MNPKSHFKRFQIKKIKSEVLGSYEIENENKVIIGKSIGYSIKQRSISATFYSTKNTYKLIKRTRGFYIIELNNEFYAYVKIHLFYSKVSVKSNDGQLINLFSENFGKSYYINSQVSKKQGIIKSLNWLNNDIELETSIHDEIELIICTIIALGYNINCSPWKFLKSES